MTLKQQLFDLINNHMKEQFSGERPTVEQILELTIIINEFNSEWLDEANDYIKEQVN